jgi:hypothetical protein
MLPNTIHPTGANFARLEKNLCSPPLNVKFATTARTKTKVMSLLCTAKNAPPTSTNLIKEEKQSHTTSL